MNTNKTNKRSVLVVDDDKASIIALMHMLGPDYAVYAAKNGQEGIELANRHLPDVILLDIVMPEMDGYEVLSLLKNKRETREIPVIFITGLVDAEDEEKGLGLGAADYISKPLRSAIVKLRIQNQIKILNQINMIKQSSIVESFPQFIMYLTADGSMSYVNPAAAKMTGYRAAEIMASGLNLIFDEQAVRDIKESYMPNTLRYGSDSFEVNMKRKDNEIKTLVFNSFTAGNGDIAAIAQDVTKMRALEIEAEKIYYDALTGIHNRRFFDENLDRVIKSLSRCSGTLSLMMIDIDFFKKYNDTYGHSEGDSCLKIVAETLSENITRVDDFVARYGGEEFSIVLPNTCENGARVLAEKLLESIRNCNIPHENSEVADCVTISIGITTGKVKHPQNKEGYLRLADEMLYKSKQNGRNRYTFAAFDKARTG